MRDYCSAHSLVSEPPKVSEPNLGLAADYHVLSDLDFPQFTLFSLFSYLKRLRYACVNFAVTIRA